MAKSLERKKSFWPVLKIASAGLCALASFSGRASQFGPVFPTHDFPTDQSFHAIYRFGFHTSSSNFVDSLGTDALSDGKSLRSFGHELLVEYQPSRQFAFGGIFNFQQMHVNSPDATGFSKSGLGDQRIFSEFRFFDEPGTSVGFGTVVKFPLYKVPTETQLANSSDPNNVALLGDGQLDGAIMLTSEHWASEVFRFRADLGMNFRTQGYASEMIYMAAAGFVTPKMDLDFKVKGTLPTGSGGDLSGLAAVKEAFASSDYALSANARQLILNPSVALWVSPKISMHFDFEMSVAGKKSANFLGFLFGIGYRWAKTKQGRSKTFQEVDIRKNIEGDRFEAEEGKDSNQQDKPREPVYDEGDIIYE